MLPNNALKPAIAIVPKAIRKKPSTNLEMKVRETSSNMESIGDVNQARNPIKHVNEMITENNLNFFKSSTPINYDIVFIAYKTKSIK
jgi:hypothetical protein